MTGEIDNDAIVFFGHRWQPAFELQLDVRERRLGSAQPMNILGAEVPAFGLIRTE